jgi:uncharacterized cysteine cluster protein YcgN (CxxCxxCC family)
VKNDPFYKKLSLAEMTPEQWESLCDHCGVCCLQKLEDADTGEISFIRVACEFLDTENCECLVYENRHDANPHCIVLTKDNVRQIKWLPDTCAYRRLAENRPLEAWHPLLSGDPGSVHKAGVSVRNQCVSAQFVHPEDIDIDIKI